LKEEIKEQLFTLCTAVSVYHIHHTYLFNMITFRQCTLFY